MDKIGEWIRYWLWDWWHAREATAYEIRRTRDLFGPTFEIGRVRVPRWVVAALLAIVAVVLAIWLVAALARVSFVSQDTLAATGQTGCFASIGDKLYVAVSCLFITYMPTVIYTLLLVLAFVAGYVTRAYVEKRRSE